MFGMKIGSSFNDTKLIHSLVKELKTNEHKCWDMEIGIGPHRYGATVFPGQKPVL